MEDAGKRTVQVNVKMKEEDYELLQRAAARLWPEAIISNSGILLGLARIAARQALSKTSGEKLAGSRPRKS
jgi:uncharacterized protein (DUF1778 family)